VFPCGWGDVIPGRCEATNPESISPLANVA
jgi:hypothetical protein